MIAIGNNKLKKRYITDSNGNEQEAKKVYIGTNLVHLHMQDSNNPFAYRITNDGKIGEAVSVKGEISNIKGNTISWNQLYNTEAPTAISGHSYYLRENINSVISKRISTVVSYTEGSTERNCCDLTLIYGAGNEPTTVEQFEADYERWFGKPLTYEPYNAGELIPAKTTAVKTIGFNQWDEEWELGTIFTTNGENAPSTSQIRNPANKKIAAIPNTSYCIKWHINRPSGNYVYFYREDGTYIGYNNAPSADFTVFTTPADCAYFRFVAVVNESTYNNDICINLSCIRNGEYEPYEEHTLQLPITTLTGKLNGEGESVVVFPNGMKKAGSVQDEIYVSGGKTYAVKRVGSVDLCRLTWYKGSGPRIISRGLDAKVAYRDYISNIIISRYVAVSSRTSLDEVDKAITLTTGDNETYIYISDSAYTDAASFKAAVQGVMLYYELATPLIYELDDFELPENYIANGLGTEELLPANDTALVTAPADMTIDYTLN